MLKHRDSILFKVNILDFYHKHMLNKARHHFLANESRDGEFHVSDVLRYVTMISIRNGRSAMHVQNHKQLFISGQIYLQV